MHCRLLGVCWGKGALPRWSPVSRESALAHTSALPVEKEKTYQRKSQLQMSPRPALPSPTPLPRCTRDSAHSWEARNPFLRDCSRP